MDKNESDPLPWGTVTQLCIRKSLKIQLKQGDSYGGKADQHDGDRTALSRANHLRRPPPQHSKTVSLPETATDNTADTADSVNTADTVYS